MYLNVNVDTITKKPLYLNDSNFMKKSCFSRHLIEPPFQSKSYRKTRTLCRSHKYHVDRHWFFFKVGVWYKEIITKTSSSKQSSFFLCLVFFFIAETTNVAQMFLHRMKRLTCALPMFSISQRKGRTLFSKQLSKAYL